MGGIPPTTIPHAKPTTAIAADATPAARPTISPSSQPPDAFFLPFPCIRFSLCSRGSL